MEAAGKMGDVGWQCVEATGGVGSVGAGTCGDSEKAGEGWWRQESMLKHDFTACFF